MVEIHVGTLHHTLQKMVSIRVTVQCMYVLWPLMTAVTSGFHMFQRTCQDSLMKFLILFFCFLLPSPFFCPSPFSFFFSLCHTLPPQKFFWSKLYGNVPVPSYAHSKLKKNSACFMTLIAINISWASHSVNNTRLDLSWFSPIQLLWKISRIEYILFSFFIIKSLD